MKPSVSSAMKEIEPMPEPTKISITQLSQILAYRRYSDVRIVSLVRSLNKTFERFEINTPLRISHFLAQVIHESGGFYYREEIWGPTKAQKRYEGRNDLGNDQPGDGYLYRGRGPMQLTGKFNYGRAGRDLGLDLVANPDLVATDEVGMLVAGWYWDTRVLNKYADMDSIDDVTVRVNGGYNGLKDRQKWLDICKQNIV